jgi:hypothetical protein
MVSPNETTRLLRNSPLRVTLLGLLALLIALLTLSPAVVGAPTASRAAGNVIADWSEALGDLQQDGSVPAPVGPEHDGAVLGIQAELAMFEAAKAADRRLESYLGLPPAQPGASDVSA